jgi:hypothetical protein
MAGSREEKLKKWEEESKVRQSQRLAYFRREFGVEPDLPPTEKAGEIYGHIKRNEPYFKTAMAGPTARMQQLANSPEFREALIGKEPTAEEFERDPALRKAWKTDKRFADKASDALTWCTDAFGDAYGAYSNSQGTEGVRQSHQFKRMLRMKGPKGTTFFESMKAAAEKNGTLDTFYEDMSYINRTFQMGLDLEKMDPAFKREAHPEHTATWADYRREHLDNIPYDTEKKKDCLAKVLVSAFEAGAPDFVQKPFSPEKAEKYAKQVKEQPIFKKICENPAMVRELLKEDPADPNKHYNTLMSMYRPFGAVPKAKANEVLRNIKGMLPMMDDAKAHDGKWKELVESIKTIDLNDPDNSGEKKLQELYDKTCGFAKGKKSMRRKQADQNCYDQSMDVLAELAKCGPFAKASAETVIDRTNEVRLGHDKNYDKISLSDFGANKMELHTNRQTAKYALDKFKDPKVFPSLPKKYIKTATTVADYTKDLAPLASNETLSEMDAQSLIAEALVLSETPAYYYDNAKVTNELSRKMRVGGKAVLANAQALQDKIINKMNDPVVKKLAEKYKDPEARKELFEGGSLEGAFKKSNVIYTDGKHIKPDPKLTAPKRTVKLNKDPEFDVSKFDAQKLVKEYEAAKNPVQQAGL